MLKICLSRVGKKKQPTYRVIVLEKNKDPWGDYLELLGQYNPRTKPKTIEFNAERIKYWISKGAKPTPTVHNLLVDEKIIEKDKVVASSGKTRKKKKAGAEETKPAEKDKAAPEKDSEAVTPEAEAPKKDEADQKDEEGPKSEPEQAAKDAPKQTPPDNDQAEDKSDEKDSEAAPTEPEAIKEDEKKEK